MIFVADSVYKELYTELLKIDALVVTSPVQSLYEGIDNHPDLLVCPFDRLLILSQELAASSYIIEGLRPDQTIIVSDPLGTTYPGTALLNAVITNQYLICNTKIVAKEVLNEARKANKQVIHVNQGYTRCTTLTLSDTVFITDDQGIYKSLSAKNMDVTLIDAGYVQLAQQPYGFIGGCAGLIGNTVYFNGDVTKHPSYRRIKSLCDKHDLDIYCVTNKPLNDIGSILHYIQAD